MDKSLSERIANNQRDRKNSDNSKNKVAFLALKQDIASARADGWSVKAIWETLSMEGKITFSYKTFCLYVSQMITTEKSATQENTREDERKKDKAKNEIKGFTFNPKPNLEELL